MVSSAPKESFFHELGYFQVVGKNYDYSVALWPP